LGVSVSGFYSWQGRAPSRHAAADAALSERIRSIHAASNGIYGSPNIHAELRDTGVRVGRKRVARLNRTPNCGHHDLRGSVVHGRPVRSLATNRNRPAVVNALLAMGTLPVVSFLSQRASAARTGMVARTQATSAGAACCSSRCNR
jgi:HTH-like domain